MDIKKNGFLIGIIAGLAVAVIGFAVLVLPAWSETSTKAEATQNQFGPTLSNIASGNNVPTRVWVANADAHKNEVNEKSIDAYKFFATGDAALEHWFDDKEQPRGVLLSRASDGIRDMLKELRDSKPAMNFVPAEGRAGYGQPNLQGFEFQDSSAVTEETKLDWMKRYNIHVKVKDALLEAHCRDFYKVQFSKVTGPAEIASRQDPRALANGLGTTIPFVVEASFLWKDVPTFYAALVRFDPAKPSPMMRIVITNLDRDRNYKPEATKEIDATEQDLAAAGGAAKWAEMKTPPESPVKVTALVEVYDFTIQPARLGTK